MSDLQSCSVWQTNGLYLKLINGFQRLCAVGESFFEVLAVGDPELRQPREHFPLFGHQLKRFGVNSVFKHVNCVTEKIMACYKTNQHIMLTAVRANFLCCDFVNSPSKTNLATKKVPRFMSLCRKQNTPDTSSRSFSIVWLKLPVFSWWFVCVWSFKKIMISIN